MSTKVISFSSLKAFNALAVYPSVACISAPIIALISVVNSSVNSGFVSILFLYRIWYPFDDLTGDFV